MTSTTKKYKSPFRANATGNTFLVFDMINENISSDEKGGFYRYVKKCHSQTGYNVIDSCLVLQKHEDTDDIERKLVIILEILEYNNDVGFEGFCGNGARTLCRYFHEHPDYSVKYSSFFIKTYSHVHQLLRLEDAVSYVAEMGPTYFHNAGRRFFPKGSETYNLNFGNKVIPFFYAETSEPHLITFCYLEKNINDSLTILGNYINIEKRADFPVGINVNHVQILEYRKIYVRTYERGVFRTTKACGTGSTSSVVLCRKLGLLDAKCNEIDVVTTGGVLKVFFQPTADSCRILLDGDVEIEEEISI